MADAESLSLAFMRAHPGQAARVLEAVAPAQAAQLLGRAPARLGAPVLGAMLPNAAARAVGSLADERALALLGALATQPLVAVLRHVPEPRRSHLIAGLPTTSALAARLLLGYMEDAVGAWADPDVLALPGDTTVREALERVRLMEGSVQRVFVTAPDGRLEGWVPLPALLRGQDAAALASVMSRPEAMLSAQTPLAGAIAHPGWERSSLLPVVESGGKLLGVLTRDALARAARRVARTGAASEAGSLGDMLARGYWNALSGGAEAMVTLLPAVARIGGKADER